MADKLRILVVEDEPNMRELVQARLEQAGYEVEVAPDGFQGLSKYRAFKPDLVILDLMLPKLDGYTICRMIKSGPDAATPVILFSARSAPDDARRGLDQGADAFVCKPFDSTTMLAKIEDLLKSKLDPQSGAVPPAAPRPEATDAKQEPDVAAKSAEQAAAQAEPVKPEVAPSAPAQADVPAVTPGSPSVAQVKPAKVAPTAAGTAPAPGEEPEPPAEQIRPGPLTSDEQAARVRPAGPDSGPAQADSAQDKPQAKGGLFKRLLGGK